MNGYGMAACGGKAAVHHDEPFLIAQRASAAGLSANIDPTAALSPMWDEALIIAQRAQLLASRHPRLPAPWLRRKPGKCAGFRGGGNRFCCILGEQQALIHKPCRRQP